MNWLHEVSIKDICDLITVKTNIKNASIENYISTENMLPNFGGVEHAEKLPTSNTVNTFIPQDILFSNIRTYFKKVWFSRFNGTASADVLVFRAKDNCDSKFLYYLMCDPSFIEYTVLTSKGAKMPRGDKDAIFSYTVSLPSIQEQKAIASVLSSLDDKIDLLHRQNKTLESMANTLFRQWFIEDAHIHWTEKKLSSFGRIICGKTPSKKNSLYFGNDVPFLKIPDMHGKVFVFKSTDNLSFAGEHSQSKKTIPPGSICVSCIATVGLVCITDVSMQTNQQINSIIPNKEYYKYFLYLLMKSMGDELNNLASGGTATLNLNTGDFSNITFLSPSENELKIFHQSISSLFDKLKLNSKQINIIENLRDTLLPKLMSGEVRVQDAEEAIASVA
ncbi:TPA: restriction endonuclease subunit S [Klebsiella aerogenes]|uniref:restriction endonuclease subunit S n=1 Tax=Enterobacteriaceae TaxID=543 RepID=UPI000F5106D8|nr:MULTISPECIES: restriction endonuclease subunit S [Enterobacteriaceae]EEF8688948.1 restriction endonuclease subunit S [Salmonella enterica]HBR1511681.1 restriction endonuclease subunit S [Klebsiella quasipneumoniae subsp. quasipneumoniae]HDS7502435.1 restriction endonuclease subunit S [Klebsiella aerogenes]AYZ17320.1 restriction endonuclease subunit S [Klebsiella sp. FDAARGOS_511]EFR3684508.1 restriction endonuclease subunit S [Salmonella enterica]